jgi:hypothetical protein
LFHFTRRTSRYKKWNKWEIFFHLIRLKNLKRSDASDWTARIILGARTAFWGEPHSVFNGPGRACHQDQYKICDDWIKVFIL